MQESSVPTSDFFSIPNFESQIQTSILPLFGKEEGHLIPLGTGFIINENGLMVTASHVIEEAQRFKTRKVNEETGQWYDHIEMYTVYIPTEREGLDPNQPTEQLIALKQAWWQKDHDIALCFLHHAFSEGERIYFSPLILSPRLPVVDENILAVGYPSNKIDMQWGEEFIKYEHKNAFSTGQVLEVHEKGREESMFMYPFPCFGTQARIDGGMSGGPIFDEYGKVIGVNTAGSALSVDDPNYRAYGSFIASVLTIEIDLPPGEGPEIEYSILYDLVKAGYVTADEYIDG